MYTYSFKITKGKFELLVTTSDREFVVDQFAAWVKKASDYVTKQKSTAGKERVLSQINAEKEITQKKIDEQLKRQQKNETLLDDVPVQKAEKVDKNLDVFYANNTEKEEIVEPKTQNDFGNILDKSLGMLNTESAFKSGPAIKKDNAFLNYIGNRKIDRKIDYLLLTAYYFTQYEQKPRFTLKQLNAKLMQNLAIILDHGVIQEALNRDYIECLPDLTGVVGASEYRLTAYGEKILLEQ